MADKVCVFKVALEQDRKIWRRVAVRRSQTLDHLHHIIFKAFDRFDPHLYSFYFPKPGVKGRTAISSALEITSPVAFDPEFFPGHHEMPGNAAIIKLSSLDLEPRQTFRYMFDFGDSWWHVVTVEDPGVSAEPGRYPRILERRGDSPPQYEDEEGWGDEDEG